LDEAVIGRSELDKFFDELKETCDQEYQIICQVFPNTVQVMNQLILRMLEKRVKPFLFLLLPKQEKINLLLYMRTLAAVYNKTEDLVKHTTKYNLEVISFERSLETLFEFYRVDYIEKELATLTYIFMDALAQAKELRDAQQDNNSKGNQHTSETLISLEMALNFMHASEESVKRCIALSLKNEIPQNLVQIFTTLVRYLGYEYVDRVLERTVHVLPVACIQSYKKTFEVVVKFFEMIYFVNQIVVFIQKHFYVDILPHVAPSPNDKTSCDMIKHTLLSKLESKIEKGIDKSLSALVSSIEKILHSQKKSDYKVKDDAAVPFSNSVTPTCAEVVGFIKSTKVFLEKNLDGTNVNLLLQEFGNRTNGILLVHFKKFIVTSGVGGLKLLSDLTEYRDSAKLFTSDQVLEKFEILKELANIHFVAPENLQTLLTESKLSKMDKSNVLEFVKTRADFKPNWIGKYV